MAGRGRIGDRGGVGRIGSWSLGNTGSNVARHGDFFCGEFDHVRGWLSLRNISGPQIPRSDSAETALNLFFAGIVALALLIGTSRWKAIVRRPVLQFFGDISYCVYLIHMLIFDLEDRIVSWLFPTLPPPAGHFGVMVLLFSVASGFTIGVAYLSRRYFEEPFMQMKGCSEVPGKA